MPNFIGCNSAMRARLEDHWYQKKYTWLTLMLLPFSWLFRGVVAMRAFFYRVGIFRRVTLPVPVIVVGNITTGGTGKTPFVIWLAAWLQVQGFRPGIVSRGVGGKQQRLPRQVSATSAVAEVGDEAVLLLQRTGCPVVVGVDRVAAAQFLLMQNACDIIISDDGLQHYRLQRTLEIAIVDGVRHFGNGGLLPAGPLREPIKRLRHVDVVIESGRDFMLSAETLVSVCQPSTRLALADFPRSMIHAVAGIGHPARFFQVLQREGFDVMSHVFPDHYLYRRPDIYFNDDLPVLMTEKDAVKCRQFADRRHWYLLVEGHVSALALKKIILSFKIKEISHV